MGEFWQGGVVGFMDEGEHMINTNMNAETYYFQTLESFLPTLHKISVDSEEKCALLDKTMSVRIFVTYLAMLLLYILILF